MRVILARRGEGKDGQLSDCHGGQCRHTCVASGHAPVEGTHDVSLAVTDSGLPPADARNTTKRTYEPGCFAAGTLVHTKEGLRPIETVKVGDWLLSKHESGEGEREYKQVTQTFVHEDRVVNIALIRKGADGYEQFAVTPEHPFWVQGKGWKEVGKLKTSWPKPTCVETLSGGIPETPFSSPVPPEFLGNFPLFITNDPEVAWISYVGGSDRFGYGGT
jgi:hypothetical protein